MASCSSGWRRRVALYSNWARGFSLWRDPSWIGLRRDPVLDSLHDGSVKALHVQHLMVGVDIALENIRGNFCGVPHVSPLPFPAQNPAS